MLEIFKVLLFVLLCLTRSDLSFNTSSSSVCTILYLPFIMEHAYFLIITTAIILVTTVLKEENILLALQSNFNGKSLSFLKEFPAGGLLTIDLPKLFLNLDTQCYSLQIVDTRFCVYFPFRYHKRNPCGAWINSFHEKRNRLVVFPFFASPILLPGVFN